MSDTDVDLFGFSLECDSLKVLIAFSALTIVIASSNNLLTTIDDIASCTSFHHTIQSLYKELVIMGLSSFILTIFSSAGFEFLSWVIYLVYCPNSTIYNTYNTLLSPLIYGVYIYLANCGCNIIYVCYFSCILCHGLNY